MALPVIAIVGRPNVGKSTLFNRLAGRRIAVVSDTPGTTRDRVSTDAEWRGRRFLLVDTGGFDPLPTEELIFDVRAQMERALDDADGVLLVVDVADGATPTDAQAAELVRRRSKPTVVVANKADNARREQSAVEFHALGLGDPIPISAYHNSGISDLMDVLFDRLPDLPNEAPDEGQVRVAIAGRPNVGKSALLNAIVDDERSIVSPLPGTTRDAVDTPATWAGRELLFIDTAGLRRRGKTGTGIEKYSVIRTLQAIERSHVVLVVLDASEMGTQQDTHVAGFVAQARRAAVIVVNKWDLMSEADLTRDDARKKIRQRFKFMPGVPVHFTSALKRTGLDGLLKATIAAYDEFTTVVPDAQLRRAVLDAFAEHQPAHKGRYRPVLKGVSQVRTRPPTFVLKMAHPELVHFSYRRYLENELRAAFGIKSSPLRLQFVPTK